MLKMATTTTWKVESMECMIQEQGYDNVVYNIHWRLYADDAGSSTSIYGSQVVSFDPSSPDYEFIPYDELDEATVISWLQGAMGPNLVAQNEETVTRILYEMMNPVTETKPLPWASTGQE